MLAKPSVLNSANRYRFIFTMRQIPVRVLRYLRKQFKTLVLAYSGGTDSTLLALIAKEYAIPIDHYVFVNTKMEYPDTISYVKKVTDVLRLNLSVVKPEKSAAELASIVVEDFDKLNNCSDNYNKSRYRCCYHAKEKPMQRWLQDSGLDAETTCLLRGLRSSDNSTRMIHCLQLIESGQFYYYHYKQSDHTLCSNPIQFISDDLKDTWLGSACSRYDIPVPQKSGCMICPIFFKFADADERRSHRWKIAERFFTKRAKTVLDAYLYRSENQIVQEATN